MDRVTCRVDPALDAQYPVAWPARVEVALAGDRTLAASTRHAKGESPQSVDDAILDFILHLETKPDFGELTRILKRFVLPD
jgi:2-methylcitrate dehydratase PrpD